MSRNMDGLRAVAAVRAWAHNECGPCVLVYCALDDVANAKRQAFLGQGNLMDATGLGRTALRSALDSLADAGVIRDTGERRGRTRKVVVWWVADRLPPELMTLRERVPSHDYADRKRTPLSKHVSPPGPRGKPRPAGEEERWLEEDRPAPGWAVGEEEAGNG